MLVLSRRVHERIVIPSIQTAVQVVSVKPGVARLGIEAPDSVKVYREELLEGTVVLPVEAPTDGAAEREERQFHHLLRNKLNAMTVGLALVRGQLQSGATARIPDTLDRMGREVEELLQKVDERRAAMRSAAQPAV